MHTAPAGMVIPLITMSSVISRDVTGAGGYSLRDSFSTWRGHCKERHTKRMPCWNRQNRHWHYSIFRGKYLFCNSDNILYLSEVGQLAQVIIGNLPLQSNNIIHLFLCSEKSGGRRKFLTPLHTVVTVSLRSQKYIYYSSCLTSLVCQGVFLAPWCKSQVD